MTQEITVRLQQWREGRTEALDEIVPFIYGELHQLAARALKLERNGHTIQPTVLVHEVYLRLAAAGAPAVESRRHFYALAARLMRQILVDYARRHLSQKRGSGAIHVLPEDVLQYSAAGAAEFTALDQALERLGAIDERKVRVLELRYFTGLTSLETAEVLGVGVATVQRDLAFATAFLQEQLRGG
jgi:hypothetical protein